MYYKSTQTGSLSETISRVRTTGKAEKAKCPAHDDRNASLSVDLGEAGRILLHCFAGCGYEQVARAGHLDRQALGPDRAAAGPRGGQGSRVVATYRYTDEMDHLLYEVLRYSPKDFKQRSATGSWTVKGIRRVPYHLPQLIAAPLNRVVFIVEGEKDVERLESVGAVATTNAGGAGVKWPSEFGDFFRGRKVVVIPDNDPPGIAHTEDIVEQLRPVAASVVSLAPVSSKPKGDVSDFLDAGGTLETLMTKARSEFACAGFEESERIADAEEGWIKMQEAGPPPLEGDVLALYDDETVKEPKGILGDAMFQPRSLAFVGADGGVGKSTLAQDWTHKIALGLLIGPLKTIPVNTVFVSEEMSVGQFRRRLRKAFSRDEVAATSGRSRYLMKSGAKVRTPEQRAALREKLKSLGAQDGLVWVENFVNIIDGADEDDNSEVADILNGILGEIAVPLNCCVVINDHAGKSKELEGSNRLRGASCKRDIAAEVLIIRKDKKNGKVDRIIEFTKTRDEDTPPGALRFVRQVRADGLTAFRFDFLKSGKPGVDANDPDEPVSRSTINPTILQGVKDELGKLVAKSNRGTDRGTASPISSPISIPANSLRNAVQKRFTVKVSQAEGFITAAFKAGLIQRPRRGRYSLPPKVRETPPETE